MALAAMRFDRPAPAAVIAVGILFTLGWLFEWRLMFPTLPALLAALALADIAPKQRLAMAALLLVTMLAVAGLTALCWDGHTGAMGLPEIIWTGKGVARDGPDFRSEKLELLALGIGQYLIGARNVPVPTDDLATGLRPDCDRHSGLGHAVCPCHALAAVEDAVSAPPWWSSSAPSSPGSS